MVLATTGVPEKTACRHLTAAAKARSEEHTSELQSLRHLVCRLLLEKKKKKTHHQKYNNNKRNTRDGHIGRQRQSKERSQSVYAGAEMDQSQQAGHRSRAVQHSTSAT